MNAGTDLSGAPEDHILRRMARHLQERVQYPVGSALWACAVQGYEECKQEMDRRLIEYIATATEKQGDPFGLPNVGEQAAPPDAGRASQRRAGPQPA